MNYEMMYTKTSKDGELITTFYMVEGEPVDAAKNLVEMFPATRCKHDHDCCGQFYDSVGVIVHADAIDRYVIVKQNSYMNI